MPVGKLPVDDDLSVGVEDVEELDEDQALLKFNKEEERYFENLGTEVFDDLDDGDEFDEVGYSMQIQFDLAELARKLRECRECRSFPRSALELGEPVERLLVKKYLQMRLEGDLDAIRYLVIHGYSGVLVFPTTEICDTFWRNVTRDPKFDGYEMILSQISSFKLNTGTRIPSVGLSTCGLEPGIVGSVVYYAVKAGYERIDCAPSNQNEKEIGVALKKLFDEGVVNREDLFISSKHWCTTQEDVYGAINKTLGDLQVSYLDLYFIHCPVRVAKDSVGCELQNLCPFDLANTWSAMEKLIDSKKTLAIGVTNVSVEILADLMKKATIVPAVVQVECHPSLEQQHLHKFCRGEGQPHISAYSPLGLEYKVLENSTILEIADELGKTAAQVALRWGLKNGHSVLICSKNNSRIDENIDIFDWELDLEEARLHSIT